MIDFESLFDETDPNEEIFYFKSIKLERSNDLYIVKYLFSFCDSVEMEASMVLDIDVCNSNGDIDICYYDIIFSIGMCKLLW